VNTRIAALTTVLIMAARLLAQYPGSVTGTVVDDAGKPVVHARVFISRALPATTVRPAAPPVFTGPHVITTMTDRQGQFISGHLAAGNYVACAQFAAQGLLDPCHWASSAPVFTVATNKTTTGVKIAMAKGATVSIHVSDAQQVLTAPKGVAPPFLRFHMVTAKGHHYEAAMVAQDTVSQDFKITIPFATPLTLQVIGPQLTVNDETGKPAAAAGRTVLVPAGTTTSTIFNYTVAGAK
jgi:hypothetical protein